jgi:hypothetical protein
MEFIACKIATSTAQLVMINLQINYRYIARAVLVGYHNKY